MESGRKEPPEECEKCGKIEKLKRCSACQQAWYCSQECQVAAWKGHKSECRCWREPNCQPLHADEEPNTAIAAARSSAKDQPKAAAAAAAPSSSSASASSSGSSSSGSFNIGSHRVLAAAPGSSQPVDITELPDDALLPCFKYRTNADPKAGDLKVQPKFSKKELAYLAEVYPGMLYDGDSCTTNLDRFIMKKVKTWHVQYLMRRQLPGVRSDQDKVPFFKALMSGEVRVASSSLAAEKDMAPPDFVYEYNELGVAVAMSMLVDHSPAGRARHPSNMPKIMIYEPVMYSNERILI